MITEAELASVEERAKKKLKEYPKITFWRDELGQTYAKCEGADLVTLEFVLLVDVIPLLIAEVRKERPEVRRLKEVIAEMRLRYDNPL